MTNLFAGKQTKRKGASLLAGGHNHLWADKINTYNRVKTYLPGGGGGHVPIFPRPLDLPMRLSVSL